MNTILKSIILSVIVAAVIPAASAQQTKNDPNLHKQIRSIAGDEWDFGPGFSYWLLHKGYSGAKMRYKFPFSFKIEFDENRANVKRLWRPQLAELGLQQARLEEVKKQNDAIKGMYTEQASVLADRLNATSYLTYKKDFDDFQKYMSAALSYAYKISNGKAAPVIERLKVKNKVFEEQVAYVSAVAPTAGAVLGGSMESGARMKEFQRLHKEMNKLYKETSSFVKWCKLVY